MNAFGTPSADGTGRDTEQTRCSDDVPREAERKSALYQVGRAADGSWSWWRWHYRPAGVTDVQPATLPEAALMDKVMRGLAMSKDKDKLRALLARLPQ
jgi:hypothetical protein